MKRTGLGGILALLLCLGLVSLEARGDDLERFLTQLRREAASKPVASRPPKPSSGEKSLCVASCGGGATVSVNNCSCLAVDQDCSAGQQGYAQCSGGSRVDCPTPCPPRYTYTAECQFGGSVSVTCGAERGTQVNHNCPYQRGYVQCTGGEKVECPPCDICSAYVSCSEYTWVECEGYAECESRQDLCWVFCDGAYTSCGGICE